MIFQSWRWITTAALSAVLGSLANAQTAGQYWQRQNIYQIITDRFYDGDPANNNADGNYQPAGHRGTSVHGGDFKGIEQKLDYIKALGATAIWISPVVVNANGEFHGYAGRDFYHVDPHWGTMADLQSLIRAAHARGILVIDDIVVNHGGDLVYSTDPGYGNYKAPPDGYHLQFRNTNRQYAPPFDLDGHERTLATLFHNHGLIHEYKDPREVELGELSGLDDFQTENPYVREAMTAIYQYWITQAGFDGFRIDTVKHVEMDFWKTWCPAIRTCAAIAGNTNFFMFGEVYDGSDAKCGSYTGAQGGGPFKLDSVLDYPLYHAINRVFALGSGDTKQIETHYHAIDANYDPAARMSLVTFLDNHDQPRFLSPALASNRTDRLAVALAFLYTSRGIPCLYYGTEQAFNGARDPWDREDMFAGQFKDGPAGVDSFDMSNPLFQLVAKLNNFRRLYPALLTGKHVNLWYDAKGPGLFAYARRLGDEEIFIVLNTAGTAQTLTNRPTLYPAGTVMVNLLNPEETITTVAGPQTPFINVSATTAKIFVAKKQLRLLDPVVVSNSPAHSANSVSIRSPIVLHFSQPMDTNSVQSAFSVTPTTSGSFTWSAAHDALTFIPDAPGMAGFTNITVRVTGAALAADSRNSLYAPYELQFRTAPAIPPAN